jgi:hypothetical protein
MANNSSIPVKMTYLAPSKHLGHTLSKMVKNKLPAGQMWQVMCAFNNEFEYKGNKYQSTQCNPDGSVKFQIGISLMREATKRDFYINQYGGRFNPNTSLEDKYLDTYETDANGRPVFLIKKNYVLKGWIEFPPLKKMGEGEVDVFYEVCGNVTRDIDAAITMVLL